MIDLDSLTTHGAGIAATRFLDLAFNEKNVEAAFEQYAAAPYTQHNPQVPDGIDGAKAALAGLVQQVPGWTYDFKRVLVDAISLLSTRMSQPHQEITAWRSLTCFA